MRVFVLNTGRCGSMTFYKACSHITNYTAGHQTRKGLSLDYPDNHIEIDNRLSWFLGTMDKKYPDAFYVHLVKGDTWKSFIKRYDGGIICAFRKYIHQGLKAKPEDVTKNYCDTVNDNIEFFLKFKSQMRFDFDKGDFLEFWHRIGAEGNLEKALKEFDIKHNSSEEIEEKTNIYRVIAEGVVYYEISYKFIGIASIIGIWALNVHAWLGLFWGVIALILGIPSVTLFARFYKKFILPQVSKIYSLHNPIIRDIYER